MWRLGYRSSTGTSDWRMSSVEGAGIFNVTTRRAGCTTARRVSRKAYLGNTYRGWRCRYVARGYESADIRCTRSRGRVVRWQSGA